MRAKALKEFKIYYYYYFSNKSTIFGDKFLYISYSLKKCFRDILHWILNLIVWKVKHISIEFRVLMMSFTFGSKLIYFKQHKFEAKTSFNIFFPSVCWSLFQYKLQLVIESLLFCFLRTFNSMRWKFSSFNENHIYR